MGKINTPLINKPYFNVNLCIKRTLLCIIIVCTILLFFMIYYK